MEVSLLKNSLVPRWVLREGGNFGAEDFTVFNLQRLRKLTLSEIA